MINGEYYNAVNVLALIALWILSRVFKSFFLESRSIVMVSVISVICAIEGVRQLKISLASAAILIALSSILASVFLFHSKLNLDKKNRQ